MLHHRIRRAVAGAGGGGVSTPVSFNPADKAANVILTNSNFTMKGLFTGVRAFDGRSSGDNYFEGSFDTNPGIGREKIGMFRSTDTLGEVGAPGFGVGLMRTSATQTGIIYNGAVVYQETITILANDVLMLRWKQSTGELWAGINGVWLNSGNPVFTNATLSTGTWHKAASSRSLTTEPVSLASVNTYATPAGSAIW